MLLLDLSHTSHSPARTGVQRVALELRSALLARAATGLGPDLCEITHDPYLRAWRPLQAWELTALGRSPVGGGKRGAAWPWRAQLRGWWQRRAPRAQLATPDRRNLPATAAGVVCPEIFTARTGRQLPALFGAVAAPRVAVFHDAIPLRLPDLTPPGTVGRFPVYLEELRQFDGIAAVSADSRESLLDYWRWAGWGDGPPVITLPLGVDHLPHNPVPGLPADAAPDGRATVLCVGSIEGRKNHVTLLDACAQLWAQGLPFTLEIVGGLQRETGGAAHTRLRALQAAGHPLHYHGWLDDEALRAAYGRSAFTVYPSLLEGFGLPVWESLRQGVPCICSARGAIAETAQGGGCLTTDTSQVDALAQAIRTLLTQPVQLAGLRMAAAARVPRRWADYASTLVDWLTELRTIRPHRPAI